jgi:Flp pilus assembly protein protease CpaA
LWCSVTGAIAVKLFGLEAWTLWCTFLLMTIAAVINARTLKVPNRLTLPALAVGLVVAILVSGLGNVPSRGGGIVASFSGAGVGLALLLPFWLAGWLGGGCVKMQAAFGAWIGCALSPSHAALLVTLATVVGGLLTAAATSAVSKKNSESRLSGTAVACASGTGHVVDWLGCDGCRTVGDGLVIATRSR